MYQRAHTEFWNSVERVTSWDAFVKAIDSRHMALAPWCVDAQLGSWPLRPFPARGERLCAWQLRWQWP